MYVAEIPNRNSPPTYLLRESYREEGKVKNRTLANLSSLPLSQIRAIARVLKGESLVAVDEVVHVKRSLPHGHVHAVLRAMEQLGVQSLLASRACPQRNLVLAMIAQRILFPSSKLAATRLWKTTTLAEELGVAHATADDLYQALDWLWARRKRIENKLAKRHLTEDDPVLYDVSSSSYFGRTCPLAQFGHNRDGRRDLPCIVYGVMANLDGRPVSLDVYAGNTADPSTVLDQVNKLKTRFQVRRVILVGDRGMLTQARIDDLRQRPGVGWLSALRSSAIRKLVEQGPLEQSLFDEKNLAEIHSPDFPGERLVACHNPLLAERRRRKREALLAATEAQFARIAAEVARRTNTPLTQGQIGVKAGRVLNKYKVGKHFELTIADNQFAWSRKQQSIDHEAALDGIYVIRTSEPKKELSADNAVRNYKRLAEVERAFRSLKGLDLLARPIHHRLDDRVKAHFFVCLLAFYVQQHLRRAWAPLLFADEELARHQAERDPVAPAKPAESVRRKKNEQISEDSFALHSFRTLLQELGAQCRTSFEFGNTAVTYSKLTEATALQARAFELLESTCRQ